LQHIQLQRRNYSQSTARTYIYAVEDFAKYFHRSPERLGPEHIRQYQAYLFRERKLSPGTIEGRTAALRFLFIKTVVLQVSNADKFVAERLWCILKLPNRKGCR
jgi:site-specific recombinase XerD